MHTDTYHRHIQIIHKVFFIFIWYIRQHATGMLVNMSKIVTKVNVSEGGARVSLVQPIPRLQRPTSIPTTGDLPYGGTAIRGQGPRGLL